MSQESLNPAAPAATAASGSDARVEVVVALDHAPLVQHVLARTGAEPAEVEHSPALGLSRLALDPAAVGRLGDGLAGYYAQDARIDESQAAADLSDARGDVTADEAPLDELLGTLRAYFRRRYAGWAPTMGKNRIVGQVTGGGGTVSYGGGTDPEPAEPPRRAHGSAGRGVTVAVLDTGVSPQPTLAGRYLVSPEDLLPGQESYPYAAGHATFVAGLVLQEAPATTVRLARVLDDRGEATSWQLAKAVVEHARSGADILNLSLVCYTADRRPPLALAAAVDRLDPRVLVVACAGNHGDPRLGLSETEHRQPAWPAALDDVVAVGSARRTDGPNGFGYALSSFSPPDAAWVDLVTQGEDVVSTYFSGSGPGEEPRQFAGGAVWSGTSFAAARVTGRIAAVASQGRMPVRDAYQELASSLTPSTDYGPTWLPPFLDLHRR